MELICDKEKDSSTNWNFFKFEIDLFEIRYFLFSASFFIKFKYRETPVLSTRRHFIDLSFLIYAYSFLMTNWRKVIWGKINHIFPTIMEEDVFSRYNISPNWKLLNDIKERTACPKCHKSRKFFCYTCYVPVSVVENIIPKVKVIFLST